MSITRTPEFEWQVLSNKRSAHDENFKYEPFWYFNIRLNKALQEGWMIYTDIQFDINHDRATCVLRKEKYESY